MPPAEQKCQGQQQGLRQHQQSPTNGNNVGIIDEDMMAIIAARSQEAAQRETTDQDWKRKQEAALVAAASRMVRLPPFSRPSADADADADADATSVGLHQRPRIVPLVGGGGDIEEGSNDTARTIGQFSTEPPINEQAQQQQEQSEAAPVAQLGESSEPISPTQLPQTVDETFDSAPEEGEEAVQTRDTGQDDEEEENHSINYEDLTDQPLVEAVLVLQEADDETEHENAYSSTDSTSRNDTTITSAAPLSTDLTSATSTGFMTPETELTVVEAKPIDQGRKTFLSRKVICLVMGLLFTAIAALSIGFAVSAKNNEGNSSSDSESNENVASKGDDNAVISPGSTNNPLAEDGDFIIPSTNRMPVLQRLARGEKLRCGVINGPGLFFYNEDGTAGGFDASLCAAVAAAATGDPKNVDYTIFGSSSLLENLIKDEIDMISAGITHTMERQVYPYRSDIGFTFSMPYLYQGLQIAGEPSLVRCGDQGLDKIASCGDIRVCSTEKSTHYQKLSSYLPGKNLIPISSREQLREAFANGTCNVIAHEGYNLAESLVRSAGYEGEYLVGATLFSKEPLAMVTRQEDTELSDFVNSVLASLIVAEASNITQSTAEKFPQTEVWSEYPTMFRDAVAAVGNYGEVFARYMEIYTPRQGLNLINYGAGGLLYSIPLGNPEGSVGTPGTTLVAISERAKLRCGLRPNRPGFAVLEVDKLNGMEVDYCRALAASIFYGRTDQVEFITVSDQREGLALLASGELDVFAGATWNLQTDVRIPGIGEGFTLTQPFFYKPATSGVGEGGDENLCLATRQVDPVWSAFVYWISAAIIQAEEHGITQGMSNFMPDVTVFGPDFSLIFQDAILAVGNYGEMYSRNLENAIPRSGRNQLNGNKASQLYPLPGIFP